MTGPRVRAAAALWSVWRTVLAVAAAAALLLWPAVWNRFPLLFADSGTYLLQVPTGSIGWDRPPFYSLFLLLFHLRLSLWPVVAAQALAAALVLRLALLTVDRRGADARLIALAALLSVASSLPWFAAQVMPDVFTGLLVIALAVLAGVPGALPRRQRFLLVVSSIFLILQHLSHLPLALAVVGGVLAWRGWRGRAWPADARLALAPPLLAAVLLMATNLAAHGRASLAPFGQVFVLARLIEDGPARAVLARDCMTAAWALCRGRAALPATADEILWSADSPLQAWERSARAPRAVADEAGAIVARTLQAAPLAVLAGAARASLRQAAAFATGDGLGAWPAVGPKLARLFPQATRDVYADARQTRGELALPAWLSALHGAAALAALALCPVLLAAARLPEAVRALALATLIALPVNAVVTGALSGPHDRYQSRVMWLPLAVLGCAAPAALRFRRPAALACA